MQEEKKIVSKVPEITPELLEQNEVQQTQWRESFYFNVPTSDQYAVTVVKSNLKILDSIDRQISFARGIKHKKELRAKKAQIADSTAEWLITVGQFEGALELATCKHKKKLIREYIKAVKRKDGDWCKHPAFEHVDGHLSQIAYREFNFFSQEHGRKVSMIRCGKCGYRNARELDDDLKRISAVRAGAVQNNHDRDMSLAHALQQNDAAA